jgi:hypothetical protein
MPAFRPHRQEAGRDSLSLFQLFILLSSSLHFSPHLATTLSLSRLLFRHHGPDGPTKRRYSNIYGPCAARRDHRRTTGTRRRATSMPLRVPARSSRTQQDKASGRSSFWRSERGQACRGAADEPSERRQPTRHKRASDTPHTPHTRHATRRRRRKEGCGRRV